MFNASEQLRLLAPDAKCFGADGGSEIVAEATEGDISLGKSIAFGMPHPIVLDYAHEMVTWDF